MTHPEDTAGGDAMPRRVLIVTWAPFFSGAERALLLSVTNLDPARYVPFVVVGTNGEMSAQLREARIAHAVIPLRHLDRAHLWAWGASVARVTASAWREAANIVHANDMPSFQPGAWAARLLRVPAISHVRFPDTAEGFRWFFRGRLARALFVSEYLRAVGLDVAPGVFAGKSEVLYDGVRVPRSISAEERAAVRRELDFAPGEVVVAITGQVSPIKGIWDFIEAARLMVERGTRPVFAVLGDDLQSAGSLRRQAEARVAQLGLADRFRFLGFRTDAPRLIPAFDIVAVPSHVEPLGNATLEAMAAGRPVVGSRVGGIPEMVVEGETGLLVPAHDPGRLARALATLIGDPETRQRYGTAGRRRAETVFGLDRHAERLQTLYDTVLAD